jgi:hypothetical protein
MAQHMVRFPVGDHERYHHPFPQSFGNTTGTHSNLSTDDGGLLKISMIVIYDQGILEDGIPKDGKMPVVPLFALLTQVPDGLILIQVIIDLKMGRLVYLKIELFIVDLILPKILSVDSRNHCQRQQKTGYKEDNIIISHGNTGVMETKLRKFPYI